MNPGFIREEGRTSGNVRLQFDGDLRKKEDIFLFY